MKNGYTTLTVRLTYGLGVIHGYMDRCHGFSIELGKNMHSDKILLPPLIGIVSAC